jgi:hypothetical protein
MSNLQKRFQSWKKIFVKSNVLFHILLFMNKTIKVIASKLICCWLSLTDFVYVHVLQETQNLIGNFF